MPKHQPLSEVLLCPNCRGIQELGPDKSMVCHACGSVFQPNSFGYYEFLPADDTSAIAESIADGASTVEHPDSGRMHRYFDAILRRERFQRVLDVGCGDGAGISELAYEGYETYGVDLPSMSPRWKKFGRSSRNFLCCNAKELPFQDDYFDVVFSLGVIEHVSPRSSSGQLSADYWKDREAYARSLLRVTKPGGRIFISCPNKSFPIDIQHGPPGGIRKHIWDKTKLNIHSVWGKSNLVSYREVKSLFCDKGSARSIEPLPLNGFFSFTAFSSGILRPIRGITMVYVNHLPGWLRSTFLNPYLLVQINK